MSQDRDLKTKQIIFRLPPDVLKALDRGIEGHYSNRTEFLTSCMRAFLLTPSIRTSIVEIAAPYREALPKETKARTSVNFKITSSLNTAFEAALLREFHNLQQVLEACALAFLANPRRVATMLKTWPAEASESAEAPIKS